MLDKNGEKLVRRIQINCLYPPDVLKPQKVFAKADKGKFFTDDGVHTVLMGCAEQLETMYPFWEFELRPLAPQGSTARYAFAFVGYRKDYHPAQIPGGDGSVTFV